MAPPPVLPDPMQRLTTPRREDLGLRQVSNHTGFRISLLPNGGIFALEHVHEGRQVMINQTLGSPVAGGMGAVYLRIGGDAPVILAIAGASARGDVGAGEDRFVWQGETAGLRHEVSLRLSADVNVWLWHVELSNLRPHGIPCDVILVQDLGLGEPGFLMNNEAYASQYLDHHVACHPRLGHVLMGRQNLSQGSGNPWVAHGCLERAVGFATDFRQLAGPAHRDADHFGIPFGTDLPTVRLQHECACAALQSQAVTLAPGTTTSWRFFGLYQADHPDASGDADLALIHVALSKPANAAAGTAQACSVSPPARSLLLDAPCAVADPLDQTAVERLFPRRIHVERAGGGFLSFFEPGDTYSRHVVLRDKERHVLRRHGAILFSGAQMLPDEATLCLTCWMHGVFGAQLTIGNTSFHRLFSISRDPYNITRGSGLRILVDSGGGGGSGGGSSSGGGDGGGWRLLTVPSAFEMGLSDCRWLYRLGSRTVTVSAVVSGEEAAVQWRLVVEGEPCRFLVSGHVILGEQEFAHAAPWEFDASQGRFSFRPEPGGLWSQRFPQAIYHLVTGTRDSLDAIGGDELLYSDRRRRSGGYAILQTRPTREFAFAVVGSMTDPAHAASLAAKYAGGVEDAALRAASSRHWSHLTRGIRIGSPDADAGAAAVDTIFPWMVHDAMVHVAVPHGLEQYSGGAWGTRDVCQGPLELFLALEHDEPARAILRILFAQQYAQRGDWPQWFMLEPYAAIQSREAHGDVIVWPLKALCDYVEATGDFAFLGESLPWRREDNLEVTDARAPIATHVAKLLATVQERFVPGTHLIRFGHGDWNDSLQPVDQSRRDWMVSSWTVALLYEQLCRYAGILRRSGSDGSAEAHLAAAMRTDFERFLIRDGTVAGYGVFNPEGGSPELLFHPSDSRTGVRYSLLPMTQGILGGLFTREQAQHHLGVIRRQLSFPDGVRLMDRPITYHGGLQSIFQRAESSAFFGREIGLMYTHAHLRQAQALDILGEAREMWDALLVVNPIAVTERVPHATLRQRNAYFSSSDAAFADRYQAGAEWARVGEGAIDVDGGWRIYSSGPGVYVNVLIRHVLGARRQFGARVLTPHLPPSPNLPQSSPALTLQWPDRPASGTPPR